MNSSQGPATFAAAALNKETTVRGACDVITVGRRHTVRCVLCVCVCGGPGASVSSYAEGVRGRQRSAFGAGGMQSHPDVM